MSVQPAQLHQLGMGTLLLNGTVLKHQYLVCLHGVGKPV